jgi:hypothetical protein
MAVEEPAAVGRRWRSRPLRIDDEEVEARVKATSRPSGLNVGSTSSAVAGQAGHASSRELYANRSPPMVTSACVRAPFIG